MDGQERLFNLYIVKRHCINCNDIFSTVMP